MSGNAADRSYRLSSVQEASPVGLVVVLYDLLVDDLKRAIAAMRRHDIEERSQHLKHGLLALQLLEGSLDMEKGGPAAHSLAAFYGHLRHRILDAQFRSDDGILAEQIALVLNVREAWRTLDVPAPSGISSTASTAPRLEDTDSRESLRWFA